jgi:iron complex outermembrane receptor protein
VGLSDLAPLTDVKAERAWSVSADLGWSSTAVEVNGTVFGSSIRDSIELRQAAPGSAHMLEIANSQGDVHTVGLELLARWRRGDFGATLTHTFLHSTELGPTGRDKVALTPRHALGLVGVWEREGRSRIGVEVFYTGSQRLEDNPYRSESEPYWIVGLLAEQRLGPFRLFINGENLGNTRQTRYDALLRPQRYFDGRWTVDAWAPLEGRVVNGGVRLIF